MSWLRNLQGQLSDLANEVLSEATEEIADPESELQVALKARSEAERQLAGEQSKNDLLEKKCSALEQNLLDMHTEMEIGRAKLETMVATRDQELKRLQIELEQTRPASDWEVWDTASTKSVDASKDKALTVLGNVEKQVEAIRYQKDEEIAALIGQHSQMINDLRESYEDRIRNLEGSLAPSTSHSSTSVIEHERHHDLFAVREQLENLSLGHSDVDSQKDEELDRLNTTVQELTTNNQSLSSKVDELQEQLAGYDSIKRQTAELTRAYNDLNTEYENYKENHGGVAQRNQDLVQRIDTLRANLIEYEERYELCKREHAETERQLEQLTQDFSRLRDAMDKASVEEEMNKMKAALESSRNEAFVMKTEVEKFRDTVGAFEDELDQLRDMNKRLIADNDKLSGTLRQLQDESVEDKYEAICTTLREEAEALRNKNRILEEQLQLVKKMNSLAQEGESGEKERVDLLEEKVKLLEQVRDGLKLKLAHYEEREEGSSAEESLTNQLREALAANSEKTEECERLRAELEEHQKEIQVRQGCVDDLIVQNNLLQVQYQQAAETIQETRVAMAEKDKAILRVEQNLVHLSEDHEVLSAEIERLKNQLIERPLTEATVDPEEINRLQEQHKTELEAVRTEWEQRLATFAQDNANIVTRMEETCQSLEQQNVELRKVAMEKHNESVSYYNELQAASGKLAAVEQAAGSSTARTQKLEEAIEKERREKNAAQRELSGLRNHLMLMEQTTTTEAIEAEKREMDLRALIADLQKSNYSANEGASETTRQLEQYSADLKTRLKESERTAEQWRSQFLSTDRLRQEVSDALQSLQGVLREISSDHEKDSATWQHSNGKLQAELGSAVQEVSELRSELDRLKFDKQAGEDEVESAQRELTSKQKVIEDLEVQIEDLKTSAHKDSNNYRIDDGTLRSLFLSYFTAPVDKKADVALLLASVLNYPPEDVAKITSSVRPNGQKANQARGSGASSFSEQFVRFLESESESARTAAHLPVERAKSSLNQELPANVRVPPSSLDEILQ